MTSNFAGPLPSRPFGEVKLGLLAQISSRPNSTRVGTPAAVERVGSGRTQRLYRACTPGQYEITAGALQVGGASADPDDVSLSMVLEPSSSFHVLPKSVDTQMALKTSLCPALVRPFSLASRPTTPPLNFT